MRCTCGAERNNAERAKAWTQQCGAGRAAVSQCVAGAPLRAPTWRTFLNGRWHIYIRAHVLNCLGLRLSRLGMFGHVSRCVNMNGHG